MATSRRVLRIVATLAAGAWLAGCGYKGPLYLPTGNGTQQAKPPVGVRPAPLPPTIPGSAADVRITPALPSYPPTGAQR
ncbi:LPS translocon maturation chaperone LptM [Achromobacter aloeverae]|nr:lipoprotein [Achromobacter aloeverae]